MLLLVSAYVADLIFGDPQWFPHPVRGMGKLITFLEKHLRGERSKKIEQVKGALLAVTVVGICACCAYLFIELLRRANPFLGSAAWIFLACTTLATKDLFLHAKAVWKKIKRGDIAEARRSLSRIAGRDTDNLSKEQIITATIESIAENTNDGIIAPLFYLILGGPVLAITYKAINTLDSMVGCKNEKYLDFGWFSARLDDIANFIPARICGFLISISSLISGKKFKSSFKTMLRDGKKHPSPNSGISEAAMAGALGIRLGGVWSYQGKPSVKPYLGEGKIFLQPSFINEALTITLIASVLMVSIGVILKWLI